MRTPISPIARARSSISTSNPRQESGERRARRRGCGASGIGARDSTACRGAGRGPGGPGCYHEPVTRLFVAIDLPETVKDQLELLHRGIPRARWTRDRQYHLTLRFLGEVEGPSVEMLHDLLRGVRAAPFELRLAGTGHFPPRGQPRV